MLYSDKILIVDDEQKVLSGFERSLRKDFNVDTAASGLDGLAAIKDNGPYAVVISDMRMPGMNGIEFLSQVKAIASDTIRIMLTGNADIQTAIDAVNEGYIFRFLNKPCPSELLEKTLYAAIEQYRLVTSERELLEKTLNGSVQVLIEILSITNQAAFIRSIRTRQLVIKIANELSIENIWQLELATMLSQIGCITIPEETLQKVYSGQELLYEEYRLLQAHPEVGRSLIAHIPRLEPVAEMIAYQEKCYNGTGQPYTARAGDDIPIGGRILKIALDFDKLVQGQLSEMEACREIEKRGDWYDPKIVEVLKKIVGTNIDYEMKRVNSGDLRPGMVIAEHLYTVKGILLLSKGQQITTSLCFKIKSFVDNKLVNEPFTILVPTRAKDF